MLSTTFKLFLGAQYVSGIVIIAVGLSQIPEQPSVTTSGDVAAAQRAAWAQYTDLVVHCEGFKRTMIGVGLLAFAGACNLVAVYLYREKVRIVPQPQPQPEVQIEVKPVHQGPSITYFHLVPPRDNPV